MNNQPVIPDHVVSTEFNNGEGVIVDLNSKRYYQLNETATLVWLSLEKGKSIDEIVAEMLLNYDVSEQHAIKSISGLLEEFRSRKLLVSA